MAMEAKEIFEALSKNIRELLSERGLGLYIPPYQRPYGWDKDKVIKLLDDILHGYRLLMSSSESFTFLGTVITIHDINFVTVQPIVKHEVPAKVLTVIDGQQRLTTLLCLCIALHNHIEIAFSKLFKGKETTALTSTDQWLKDQTLRLLSELATTFYEMQPSGESPLYPRMIRSFNDQWSTSLSNAHYESPIANLIFSYSKSIGTQKATEFRPAKRDGSIEGEAALVDRYLQISRFLKNMSAASKKEKEDFEELPTVSAINQRKEFQSSLLNHEFPPDVYQAIYEKKVSQDYEALVQLILLARYVLTRVAVTVVRGKNEDYAFTIFESLNTTGEPLTAFETFKPRVVSAERLEKYEKSKARAHIDEISNYLSKFPVGEPLQAATRDLLVVFAAAETGFKLSKRLADQRRYLKDEFERYEADETQRLAFISHLKDTALFKAHAWDATVSSPVLYGLPVDATTDMVKLCLSLLTKLNHTVTIAPLVRFYSTALSSSGDDRQSKIQEFEEAIKAMTAFSVLWRMSHRGTANIDSEYRDILSGANSVTGFPPLARGAKPDTGQLYIPPNVNAQALKEELKERLGQHGEISTLEKFVAEASAIAAYTNNALVARFILLAAYHDSVEDTDAPGLIVKGKSGVAPCLTYDGFKDERFLSLEHIAPQQKTEGWPDEIYTTREIVHRIGNLVLLPIPENSSMSSRTWQHKRVLYQALSAPSQSISQQILTKASDAGVEFAGSTQTIVENSRHLPHLSAIGCMEGDWSLEFIDKRSRRILELAWDRLYAWLS